MTLITLRCLSSLELLPSGEGECDFRFPLTLAFLNWVSSVLLSHKLFEFPNLDAIFDEGCQLSGIVDLVTVIFMILAEELGSFLALFS